MQKVVVDLLNAIYEQDCLGCSYGFRPGYLSFCGLYRQAVV